MKEEEKDTRIITTEKMDETLEDDEEAYGKEWRDVGKEGWGANVMILYEVDKKGNIITVRTRYSIVRNTIKLWVSLKVTEECSNSERNYWELQV